MHSKFWFKFFAIFYFLERIGFGSKNPKFGPDSKVNPNSKIKSEKIRGENNYCGHPRFSFQNDIFPRGRPNLNLETYTYFLQSKSFAGNVKKAEKRKFSKIWSQEFLIKN